MDLKRLLFQAIACIESSGTCHEEDIKIFTELGRVLEKSRTSFSFERSANILTHPTFTSGVYAGLCFAEGLQMRELETTSRELIPDEPLAKLDVALLRFIKRLKDIVDTGTYSDATLHTYLHRFYEGVETHLTTPIKEPTYLHAS